MSQLSEAELALLYNLTPVQRSALDNDFVAVAKAKYDEIGDGRTNLAYGYVNRGA